MDLTGAFDQMQSMLTDLAPLMFKYYNNLLKEGFTEDQAFQLALQYQKSLFEGARK